MTEQAPVHAPVLVKEVKEKLLHSSQGTYVDATFGRGGHSREILARLGPAGRLFALDKDPAAVASGWEQFGHLGGNGSEELRLGFEAILVEVRVGNRTGA